MEPEFEGANVCRVAALSTLLGADGQTIRELAPELEALGLTGPPGAGEAGWAGIDPLELFAGLRDRRDANGGGNRVETWRMVSEEGRPEDAIAFAVEVLGSRLERESSAAASALWREVAPQEGRTWRHGLPDAAWRSVAWPPPGSPDGYAEPDEPDAAAWVPERWDEAYWGVMSGLVGDPYQDVFLIAQLVRWRLGWALRSPDPVARSLAMAAFAPSGREDAAPPPDTAAPTPIGNVVVSTMIHGTWGWKGDWWRPRGDFHEFILRNHRPNLYSRGAKFSWSGAYHDAQREIASTDFLEWATEVASSGLLSAPVTQHVEAAVQSNARVVDVRLPFDPVLGLARTRQRLPAHPNVTTVLLTGWRLDHGATHRDRVWRDEDVAHRGGL
jgi:hypothetical protein